MAFKMSEETRTVRVYNLRADTNEFIGASDAWIAPHTGLPSNCTDIAPPDIPASHIAVFDAETQTWSLHEDHRGGTVYDTTTGNQVYISAPGPLPENVTSVSPGGEYQNPVRRSEILAGTGSAKVAHTEAIKSLSNVSGREADIRPSAVCLKERTPEIKGLRYGVFLF